VLDVLGQGGMGLVSAARQTSINRTVAVKVLRPDKQADLSSRQKFLSEAVVTGELEHPNIVPIYDLGKDQNGALFYSMKRVKGRPWDTVRASRWPRTWKS
jgi:serine/threonine protein kinase